MASKSAHHELEKAEAIEELLDAVDKTLDRVKVLYEQFFLGIQKQPPTHLHTDVERKLRELHQMQIRNTALRYRFATVQQKFGSYNNYWRRTLRQIENGTYHRNLAKIGRQAALTGEAIPDEILAAMPKRMREQVMRDREIALARAKRRDETVQDDELLDEVDTHTNPTLPKVTRSGAHILDEDEEFDLDAYFAAVTSEDATNPDVKPASPTPAPAPRAATFEGELPTEADALDTIDPPTTRPAPVHPGAGNQSGPNPAVRAAVGVRVATPPAGVPVAPRITQTSPPPTRPSQPIPTQRAPAPSQGVRPLPVMPGASTQHVPVPVETLSGPFPRVAGAAPPPAAQNPNARTAPGGFGSSRPPAPPARPAPPPTPPARPAPPPTPRQGIKPVRAATEPGVAPRMGPPPGMTDADVNALYAKYVKAKEAVGEKAGPGAYGKLLQTINAQAPKIMEQYKAKGVDFQVVVKDNQVVIRAKPKP